MRTIWMKANQREEESGGEQREDKRIANANQISRRSLCARLVDSVSVAVHSLLMDFLVSIFLHLY